MFGIFKHFRRKRLRKQLFPAAWETILRANVALYNQMPEADRIELKQHILVFIDEKNFEGCNGIGITDEIRVTIAANACILMLRRKPDYFPSLVTILVYPEAFVVTHTEVDEHGLEYREANELAGESWDRGNVILAWSSAKHGASDARDGLNVVLHEFAHQLDGTHGDTDGAPPMPTREAAKRWAEVFSREYELLLKAIESDEETVLDDYGAENPAEFFAVCVETFFERPHQLKKHHSELYEQLATYFNQDPANWPRDAAASATSR
jgi:Mlc titration factor MtfA (ptsG expression regulator)